MSAEISLGYNGTNLQLAGTVTEETPEAVPSVRGDLAQEGILSMNRCVRKEGPLGLPEANHLTRWCWT